MRAAAPAQFPVASRGVWHALLALLVAAATASVIGWLGWHATWSWVSFAVVVPAGVALALWPWIRQGDRPRHRLVWDGAAWHLDGLRREAGQPELIMDGGAWMLLRWQVPPAPPGNDPPSRPRWLPMAAADEPTNWHAFRVAVVTAAKSAPANTVVDLSA